MRNRVLILLTALAMASCAKNKEADNALYPAVEQSPEEQQMALGKEIFNGKGMCYSCHLPDKKIIGPSLKEINQVYLDKQGDMKAFLLEKADPLVDPAQYGVMKTNFNVTKNIPEAELDALITYIKSIK